MEFLAIFRKCVQYTVLHSKSDWKFCKKKENTHEVSDLHFSTSSPLIIENHTWSGVKVFLHDLRVIWRSITRGEEGNVPRRDFPRSSSSKNVAAASIFLLRWPTFVFLK